MLLTYNLASIVHFRTRPQGSSSTAVDNIFVDTNQFLNSGSGKGLWGLDGVGSGQEQMVGACEYGNELSGSVKCREFLD